MAHQVEATSGISYRTVFVYPSAAGTLPQHGAPLEISALTRELILEASSFGARYRPGSPEARLTRVLHDRLSSTPLSKLAVPLARDARLRRVCEALLENPSDSRDLKSWGRLVGASSRTLARRFLYETGMTFCAWQQHMRLSIACDRLARGESVTRIALDLGYASPSAFSAMFRRVLGTSPSHYPLG
jgi:AraC-like DNA-binding protein